MEGISPHERMEVVNSVLLCQLIVGFETRLEQIFKQLEVFRFPVKLWRRCRKWLWQFGNFVTIVMEFCRIIVVCQLLTCQQNLVCLNCLRGVFAAKLELTCWAVLFCSPKDVLGEQYTTSSWTPVRSWRYRLSFWTTVTMSWRYRLSFWTPVTMSWTSSGPEFCVIRLWKKPASGWGSFSESSSFVPWLVLNAFWEASGVVLEWPCSRGFMRKSPRRAYAPIVWSSVLLNSFDNLFGTFLSISSETWVM